MDNKSQEIIQLKADIEQLRADFKELEARYERSTDRLIGVFLGGCLRIGGVDPKIKKPDEN